ncbi:hypothetical protein PABG_11641 [Paracoccidioides brasiliensis Pb03]|nr:hypothetical protein PABG_11641 [Paracoccidioides brasiliensis Pb03]
MPYSRFLSRQRLSPQAVLRMPLLGSHPVLVARRLLILGSFLQGIPPSSAGKLAGLTSDHQDIMNRVVRTASRLVTNDDELVTSLDGIEAVVVAQMMGLDTGNTLSSIILEPETQDRIDPDYMWFRIVSTDRYLSLMLGLPQGSSENVFASQKVLQNCMAVECLERLESVAAGTILQRNVGEQIDLATIHRVDKMLQEAAALMPPRWWPMTSNGPQDDCCECRRAIVAQFVAFRGANLSTAYCRGLDFVAFIASTTLCIAHMEAHRQHQFGYGKDVTVFQSLQHQRLSDRGLLERTLEIMEKMAQMNHDVVAQNVSTILQSLLAIENNSASGACYRTTASLELYKEPQSFGAKDDNLNELHVNIPYFGTIKFEHSPTISMIEQTKTLPEGRFRNVSMPQTTDTGHVFCEPVLPLMREQHRGHQNDLTSISRLAGYQISTAQPANTDWQSVPSSFGPPDPFQQSGTANWDHSFSYPETSGEQEPHLLVPGLAADVNDWPLQGVEIALFSSFTKV